MDTYEEPRYYKRKNRMRRLFLKTFFITITVVAAVFGAGWLTLRSVVKPPVIPEVIAANDDTEQNNNHSNNAAYYVPDAETDATQEGEAGTISSPLPDGFTHADRKPDFYTFLIFGLDEGVNTDTIMVAAYDGVNKKAYVIGIPRDSKINVQRKLKKINAAYPIGTLNGGGKEGGVQQLRNEIKTIIGFIPDYYVCVNLKAFTQIVDAVDGIEVDIPFNMVYDDPDQDLHINIPKGLRTLNGEEALKFARFRQANDGYKAITDYQRIENQQIVIKEVLAKLLNPANWLKIPEFISIFTENVYTNIRMDAMPWFAEQLYVVKNTDALETYTMPTTGTSGKPNYYELLDEEAIVELLNRTINPYVKDLEAKDLDITQ